MPKLKWKWLTNEMMVDVSKYLWARLLTAFGSAILSFFIVGLVEGPIMQLPNPDSWLLIVPMIVSVVVGILLPRLAKMHFLYGLGHSQADAIKWYETLTTIEKAQLPVGWDAVVRECGGEYYGNIYLATKMHRDGKDVIALYRRKNEELNVPDYRIELYLEMMQNKADELSQDIADRKEIEAKIASMP